MKCSVQRLPILLTAAACALLLSACSEGQLLVYGAKRIAHDEQASNEGVYKVGTPYKVDGVWYYPKVDYTYVETGIASWYGPNFHGKRTANGEEFDQNLVTAAHRTLPLPSVVRVTNLENGRSIKVRVNDRGPFAHGRIIDVSRQAAQLLGFYRKGTAKVRVEVMAQESRQLAALYGHGSGGVQLAKADGSEDLPPVHSAPRVAVSQAPLDGPARTAPTPVATARPAAQPVQMARVSDTAEAHPEVTQEPVEKTSMYVQAGAFTEYDNANRLKARLAVLGPTQVSQVQIDNQTFFRVRIGPIRSLKSADSMLERVIGAGHGDARLIVDR